MIYKLAGIGVAIIFITISVLFVVIISPLAVSTRQGASTLCAAMLGMPPAAGVSVTALSGNDAEILAMQRTTNSALPTGEDAYRFVTSLNGIVNWRHLPAAEVAAWSMDPASMPLPEGAVLDVPWPAPAVDPDPEIPAEITPSVYEAACATVLHRADQRAKAITSSQISSTTPVGTTSIATTSVDVFTPTTMTAAPTTVADPQRAPLVAAVMGLIGTHVTEHELWQAISPRPDLDPKQMMFEQLAASRPVTPPQPGDVACYDFTLSGPTHCALVISPTATGLPQIATPDSAGTLVAQVVPMNVTYLRPEGFGVPELLPQPAPAAAPDQSEPVGYVS